MKIINYKAITQNGYIILIINATMDREYVVWMLTYATIHYRRSIKSRIEYEYNSFNIE
jgi:hypothetical protein